MIRGSFAILAGLLAISVGCNSSGFSGGGSKAPSESSAEKKDEDAKPAKKPAKTRDETPESDSETDKDPLPVGVENPLPDVPAGAVAAGSFRAWAEPQFPPDGVDYKIVIEVTLPDRIDPATYTKEDLSGTLTGTDGYQQAIEASFAPIPPPLPIIPPFDPRGQFQVTGRVARLSFMVLGADAKVRDTIAIRSAALNETQTVSIVFQ